MRIIIILVDLFSLLLLHRDCNCLDSFIFTKHPTSYTLGRLWRRRSRNKL